MNDHAELRSRLDEISQDLGDEIMSVLREAIEAGERGRPANERVLSRARAAVDKAAGLLAQLDETGEAEMFD